MEVRKEKLSRVMREIIEILDYTQELKNPEEIKKYTFYVRGAISSLVEVIDFDE